MNVHCRQRPGRKASVCSVAIVGLWLCVPSVSGNSPLVAAFATDFFGVNSHCVKKKNCQIVRNLKPS